MGKQVTEMLKGTLEGIVLAILSGRPAYGYEITAWLREQGFSDIAEGHRLRAAHQDRAARPRRRGEGPVREGAAAQGVLPQRSGTGIPRRVLEDLELPHRTARTAPRRRQIDMAAKWLEKVIGAEEAVAAVQGAHRAASRRLSHGGRGDRAVPDATSGRRRRQRSLSMFEDLADLFEQARGGRNPDPRDRRGRPRGVRRGVRSQLPGGRVDRPGAGTADRRHRCAPPQETPEGGGRRDDDPIGRRTPFACRVWRSRTRSCTCCAAWTSTWRGAASSPCSAPTARARPRS